MKKLLFALFALFVVNNTFAQPTTLGNPTVGFQQFGAATTQTRINGILYPVYGIMNAVYPDTASANATYVDLVPGFQIWTSSDGKFLIRNNTATKWLEISIGGGSAGWNLTGNAGTTAGTNFIGTTDAVSFVVKTNNTERARFLSTGNVGIGTTTPLAKLHVEGGFFSGAYDATSTITIGLRSAAVGSATDGKITANGEANLVVGFSQDNDADVSATGTGGISMGFANDGSKILNEGSGSFVGGMALSGPSLIRGAAEGTFTWGALTNTPGLVDTVENTGVGSFVAGNGASGSLYNTGVNSFVFGSGYNNTLSNVFSIGYGSSQFLLDGTTGHVGIGTTTPDSTLHVVGGVKIVTGRQGAGKVLTSNASGGADWETNAALSPAISSLTAATGTNSIDNGGFQQEWEWNSLAADAGLSLQSNSTAGSGTPKLFLSQMSGANANSSIISYAGQFVNSHTGTSSTNIALAAEATGGTNNYAILVPSGGGRVGIGTSAPDSLLTVEQGIWGKRGVRFSGLASSSNATDSMMVVNASNGAVGYRAIPTGGSGLTVGTTTITSGTNTRILYNNSGVLGEYAVTGSGTTAVLSTSPTFTTAITSPIVYGGSAVGSTLTLQSTSANGTDATEGIVFQDGSVKFGAILNSGQWGIGTGTTASSSYGLTIRQVNDATNDNALRLLANNGTTQMTLGYNKISTPGGIEINGLGGITFTTTGSITGGNMNSSGRFFFGGTTSATGRVHIAAGTATASTAPLKFTSGTNLTAAEAGAIEYDGTELYETNSTTVRGNVIVVRLNSSSAGTLTLATTYTHYVFTGTTTTWTLPAVSGTTSHIFFIKNRGSGAITLNAAAAANEIYTTSAVNTLTINAGESVMLLSDGTYWLSQ